MLYYDRVNVLSVYLAPVYTRRNDIFDPISTGAYPPRYTRGTYSILFHRICRKDDSRNVRGLFRSVRRNSKIPLPDSDIPIFSSLVPRRRFNQFSGKPGKKVKREKAFRFVEKNSGFGSYTDDRAGSIALANSLFRPCRETGGTGFG